MCFEVTKSVDGLNSNQRSRQLAINRYYANPNYCKKCGTLITIKCGQRTTHAREKTFCGNSCAASFCNKGIARFKGLKLVYPKCSECNKELARKKKRTSTKCIDCVIHYSLFEMTIRDSIPTNEKWSAVKFNKIRLKAREVAEKFYKMVKHCKFCKDDEFDSVVEVCHIRPISYFPLDTQLKIVNSKENLVYLCPSHHKLLDKGLISI